MNNNSTIALSRPVLNAALTWLPPAILFALIAWGTLAPQDPMPKYFHAQDKFEHLGAFLLMGATLAAATPRRYWGFVTAFCVALAIGVEIGQAILTLHREPSLKDAAASTLGALLGVGGLAFIRQESAQ